MDDLDHKILQLLAENARMPVKDIAQRVSLTSPAVSSRIHRLEQEGVIGGYTVVLRHPDAPAPGRGADLGTGGRSDPRELSDHDRAGAAGLAVLPRDRQLQLYN